MQRSQEFLLKGHRDSFLKKATLFADDFSHFSLCQSNDISYPHEPFSTLLAIGACAVFEAEQNSFDELLKFHQGEWLFGFFGYDLKNQTESLQSQHENHTCFRDIGFFKPEILIEFESDKIRISATDPEAVFQSISSLQFPKEVPCLN